ncbi:LacI family DNA-binding transcriptional regulator [Paenibacillus roseipurpureus]
MKVSIFDVAKKSGLSVVTVSRVINQAVSLLLLSLWITLQMAMKRRSI